MADLRSAWVGFIPGLTRASMTVRGWTERREREREREREGKQRDSRKAV